MSAKAVVPPLKQDGEVLHASRDASPLLQDPLLQNGEEISLSPLLYSSRGPHSRFSGKILVALLLLLMAPLVLYYILSPSFFRVPFVDDFDSLLLFGNEYAHATSFSERLALVLRQHNEHRIVATRLIALLVWTVGGSLSFPVLSWCAAVLLSSFFTLLALTELRRTSNASTTNSSATTIWARMVALMPISLLLFQPRSYESLMWPTLSIATGVLLLAAWIVVVLLERTTIASLGGALTALLVAVFSLGNGIVLLPAGLMVLLLQKRWQRAAIWTAGGTVVTALFFMGYHEHVGHPRVIDSLPHVSRNALYVLYFLGTGVSFGNHLVALSVGTLSALWISLLLLRGYASRNPRMCGLLLFLLGSFVLNGLARSEFGVDLPMSQNRYFLLSCLMSGLVLSTMIEESSRFRDMDSQKPRVADYQSIHLFMQIIYSMLVITPLIVFQYYSYAEALPHVTMLSRQAHQGFRKWLRNGTGLLYPDETRASRILNESINEGVMKLTPRQEREFRPLLLPK